MKNHFNIFDILANSVLRENLAGSDSYFKCFQTVLYRERKKRSQIRSRENKLRNSDQTFKERKISLKKLKQKDVIIILS